MRRKRNRLYFLPGFQIFWSTVRTGIAVGMATNIPPHNLRETIDGVLKIIENKVDNDRDTEIEEILDIIKGPDFPTGAMILGKNGINEAYRTGQGKIKVRAVD